MHVARPCATMLRHGSRVLFNAINKKGATSYHRSIVTTPTGKIPPEPQKIWIDFCGVIISIPLGIYIGTFVSKTMANYLEENDLFVHLDDDDDDD